MGSQQNELNLHLKVFENTQFSDEFLNTKLINLYCKHMICTNLNKDSKANRLLAASSIAHGKFVAPKTSTLLSSVLFRSSDCAVALDREDH